MVNKERWFANFTLLSASVASGAAGLLAYGTARNYHPAIWRQALLVGGPCLLSAGFLACFRLPLSYRTTLSITLLSLAVSAYAAEVFLRALPNLRVRMAARRFGLAFDSRKRFEVVQDLRREGKDAWPAVFPTWQGFKLQESGLLPLGGISKVTTVFCNEMGAYLIYESDEHGFHNPKGIWSSPGLELAIVGDSFAQGACIPSDQDFVSLIRQVHPQLLNLGMLGNGPLLELAGLKEFLPALKPRRVLWVYTEGNDLTIDLDREKRHPLLMNYLLPGNHQDLRERQAECYALLRKLIDERYALGPAGTEGDTMFRFWRLWAVRRALGLSLDDAELDTTHVDLALFRRVLEEAKRTAGEWGAEVIFVYLPVEGRYFDDRTRREHDWLRERVLAIVDDLHLPLVDLHPAFSGTPDISLLYAYHGGHFSPAGNRLVADAILEALRRPKAN